LRRKTFLSSIYWTFHEQSNEWDEEGHKESGEDVSEVRQARVTDREQKFVIFIEVLSIAIHQTNIFIKFFEGAVRGELCFDCSQIHGSGHNLEIFLSNLWILFNDLTGNEIGDKEGKQIIS
jgi:hypothetical protein